MAIGIVSDKDFDLEETKIGPSLPKAINGTVVTINKGRGLGNKEVPESLRKIIGETSIVDGRQEGIDLAKSFGISPSSVSAYAHGNHSTSSYDKPTDVASHLDTVRSKISKRAINKLSLALRSITPDKLAVASVKDLSGVAKDMSVIIKQMEPDDPNANKGGEKSPTFMIYAPQFIKEESLETVYASRED